MFLKFSYISNSAIRIRKWPCWLCPVLEPHQIWIIVTVASFVVKEADWKSYLVVILFSVCRRNSGCLDFSGFDTSKDYRLGIFWKVPLFEFVWCFLRLATLTGRTHTGPCGFSHCFQQLVPWMVVIDVGGLESVSIKVHFEHIASDLASGGPFRWLCPCDGSPPFSGCIFAFWPIEMFQPQCVLSLHYPWSELFSPRVNCLWKLRSGYQVCSLLLGCCFQLP